MAAEIEKDDVDPKTGLRSHAAPLIERAPLPLVEVQGAAHYISHANAAFCRLLGKTRAELVGKPFAEIVFGGNQCVPLLDQVYQTGEAVTHVLPDEAETAHWLYAMWPALDANECSMGVIIQMTKAVGFRQNTTAINEALLVSSLRQHELTEEAENLNEQLHKEIAERKGIELELQAARDLAVSASRAKDDFLAALSHDLRTPLSPILLLASEAAANEKLPLAMRHTFEIIAKNIAVEAQLIDDLLDVTRITQNKLSLNMQPVDAHELLRSAVETVQGDVDFKHIRLTLDLAANPCMVLGDATRLQQIFWNLLRNAVKFTPNQGGIQILTHLKDTLLVIQVVDTGIGLTTAETERVFSAFAQGDHAANTGSHRFGGLGLGLAISEKLTQLHSGKIFCASEGRGKGATFTVELPQLTEEQLQTVSGDLKKVVIADAKAYPPGRRILLVEDHEPTRSALAFLLTRRYFEVVAAASVTEACELAAKNTIDLVISDIGLPDGNGYELMTQLRDTYGLKGIALTGYGMEEDVTRSKVAGFVTHLTKPVHIHALVTALSHPDILSPRQN